MRVLVSAGSRHGATAEIAAALGQVLEGHGLEVAVLRPEDVATVRGYDAVVLGSAVYAGHWLEQVRDLVDRTGEELVARPVWLFSSGPVGVPLRPDDEAVDVRAIAAATGAREHRVFAGRIDRSLLGFGERALVRALHVREGDFRDWDEIRGWASQIAGALAAHAARAAS